jgi:nonspecific dipeptidase
MPETLGLSVRFPTLPRVRLGGIDACQHVYHPPCPDETLMRRWRYPSLSIHGFEGAFYGKGAKTVIPRKVIGKFSIRLVPDQTPDEIIAKVEAGQLVHGSRGMSMACATCSCCSPCCVSVANSCCSFQVTAHVNAEFAKLGSTNKISVTCGHGGKPWVSDVNHPNYLAGRKATQLVYGVEPDLTREGGSIPVTLTFQVSSLLLSFKTDVVLRLAHLIRLIGGHWEERDAPTDGAQR